MERDRYSQPTEGSKDSAAGAKDQADLRMKKSRLAKTGGTKNRPKSDNTNDGCILTPPIL